MFQCPAFLMELASDVQPG